MKNEEETMINPSMTFTEKKLKSNIIKSGKESKDEEDDFFSVDRGYSRTMKLPLSNINKQNIINIFGSDFVNINEDFSAKPNTAIFDDVCSMCSSKIYYKKYICVICPNCVLCEECQEEHLHPIIKTKYTQLSNIGDIYNYLNNYNPELKNEVNDHKKKFAFFSKLFNDKFELKIYCNSLNFSMRPNQKFKIPITIQNLSKAAFDCTKYKLYLFARNNKDLKVLEKNVDNILNVQQQIDVNMILESNDVRKKYSFTIGLYCLEDIKIKSNTLSCTVEVNDDIEDELLNEEFKDYPKIIVMNKDIKKGVKQILEDESITQEPVVVMQFLVNNKGDIDKTIKNLKTMKSDKFIL